MSWPCLPLPGHPNVADVSCGPIFSGCWKLCHMGMTFLEVDTLDLDHSDEGIT